MTHAAPARLLLIEDEAPIRKFLCKSLQSEGYLVRERDLGEEGLRQAAQEPPEIIILDLGLPDIDGVTVLKRLREWYTAPILILSARDQEAQKVEALDGGADDYLTKPFSVPELLARLRVLLRRANRSSIPTAKLTLGNITVDLDAHLVERAGKEIKLTPTEYKLLVTMLKNVGKVHTHRYLIREIWGPAQVVESHNLRVLMASLRRKVEADSSRPKHLLTETGVGYRCRE
jgi:two-component system, OmpR family, KDP operon response regulator KdpE